MIVTIGQLLVLQHGGGCDA